MNLETFCRQVNAIMRVRDQQLAAKQGQLQHFVPMDYPTKWLEAYFAKSFTPEQAADALEAEFDQELEWESRVS